MDGYLMLTFPATKLVELKDTAVSAIIGTNISVLDFFFIHVDASVL